MIVYFDLDGTLLNEPGKDYTLRIPLIWGVALWKQLNTTHECIILSGGKYRNTTLTPDEFAEHWRKEKMKGVCKFDPSAQLIVALLMPGQSMSEQKISYARPGYVLIDNDGRHKNNWEQRGGRFFLFKNNEDTITNIRKQIEEQ